MKPRTVIAACAQAPRAQRRLAPLKAGCGRGGVSLLGFGVVFDRAGAAAESPSWLRDLPMLGGLAEPLFLLCTVAGKVLTMVAMPKGRPRSVLDPVGDAYDAMLRRFRASDGTVGGSNGSEVLQGGGDADSLSSPPQPRLTGAAGLPALVAGAVNAITAKPNSSSKLRLNKTDVTLSRGRGADVSASAVYGLGAVKVAGTLAPPSGRREVGVSNLHASGGNMGVEAPKRVRIFNTDQGELRYELTSPFRLLFGGIPVVNIRPGQYVVRNAS